MITGAIIGGGAASRFGGRPKGLERVGGVRIVDRVAAALRPNVDSLVIAPGDVDAASWIPGAPVATDVLPIKASVTGVHAALAFARSDIIAVAWDMPFVPPSLIAKLRSELRPGVDAVVPRPSGQAEPLCAAYSGHVGEKLRQAVGRGVIRMTDILDGLGSVIWLDDAILRTIANPEVMFFNVNSPADLERAGEIDRSL
jgi:molybdopterin-guanine dinucleotide biosynthesis protein A